MSKTKRGFAAMDPAKVREIASKGGKAAQATGRCHRYTPEEAREAGKKSGPIVSSDRAHMARIGRLGGLAVSKNRDHMATIGAKGGRVAQGVSTVADFLGVKS